MTKSEIARHQGLSVTHINRLLRDASRVGVVKISVTVPRCQTMEEKLQKQYGLKAVRVIEALYGDELNRNELARQAALVFDQVAAGGAKIGVGSGRTLFEMAASISERPRDIELFPLNVIWEQDSSVHNVSANTVATIIWFKSTPLSKAHRIELFEPTNGSSSPVSVKGVLRSNEVARLRRSLSSLDAYFLTTSLTNETSRLKTISSSLISKQSKDQMAIGDIAFNALDLRGHVVETGLEDLMFNVSAEELRHAAGRPTKRVVMIADRSKAPAIQAVLAGQFINELITDSDAAEQILSNALS